MAQRGVPGPAHLLNLGAKAQATLPTQVSPCAGILRISALPMSLPDVGQVSFTPSKPDSGWPSVTFTVGCQNCPLRW
jgi:hypothetical protein